MPGPFYTLATWRVRDGENEAFVEAWRAVGEVFSNLPGERPAWGTLVQSLDDEQLYVSFGPWPSAEAIAAMRADPDAQAGLKRLMDLCDQATPGGFRLVEHVEV